MSQEQRQSYSIRPLGFRITPSSNRGGSNVRRSVMLSRKHEKKDESLERFVANQTQAQLLLHFKRNIEYQRRKIAPVRQSLNRMSKNSQESRSPNTETAFDENTYRLRLQSKLQEIHSNHSSKKNLTIQGSPKQFTAVDTFDLAKQHRILETYGLNTKITPNTHRMGLQKNHSHEHTTNRFHDLTSRIKLEEISTPADIEKSQKSMMFKDDSASCQTLRQAATFSIGTDSSAVLMLQDSQTLLKKDIGAQKTKKLLLSAADNLNLNRTSKTKMSNRRVSKQRTSKPKIACSIKVLKSSNNPARLYQSKIKESNDKRSSLQRQTLRLRDVDNPINASSDRDSLDYTTSLKSVQPKNIESVDQTLQANKQSAMQKTNLSWCSSSLFDIPMMQQYINANEEKKRNRLNSDSKESILQPVRLNQDDLTTDDCNNYMGNLNQIQKHDNKPSTESTQMQKTKRTLNIKSQLIQLDIASHTTKHATHSNVVPPTSIQNQRPTTGAYLSRNAQKKFATALFCRRHFPESRTSFPKQAQHSNNKQQNSHFLTTNVELNNHVVLLPVKIPDIEINNADDDQAENYRDSILERACSQQTIDRVSTLQIEQQLMRLRSGGLNLLNSQQSLIGSSQSQYWNPFQASKESFEVPNEDDEFIDAYLMNGQPIFKEGAAAIQDSDSNTRVDTYSSINNNMFSFRPVQEIAKKKKTLPGRNLSIPRRKSFSNGRKKNINILSTFRMERSHEETDNTKVDQLVKILNSRSTKQLDNYDGQKWLKTFCSSDRQFENIVNNHVVPKRPKIKNKEHVSPDKIQSREIRNKVNIRLRRAKGQEKSCEQTENVIINMDLHKVVQIDLTTKGSIQDISTELKKKETASCLSDLMVEKSLIGGIYMCDPSFSPAPCEQSLKESQSSKHRNQNNQVIFQRIQPIDGSQQT